LGHHPKNVSPRLFAVFVVRLVQFHTQQFSETVKFTTL